MRNEMMSLKLKSIFVCLAVVASAIVAKADDFAGRGNEGPQVSEYFWNQGLPGQNPGATPMISTSQGFCYLTKIQGHFEGAGESVFIQEFNGSWQLTGSSMQAGVGATAKCVRYTDIMSLTQLGPQSLSGELMSAPANGAPEQVFDLGPAKERFCFFTKAQGKFQGGGERVQFVNENGTIRLRGAAMQDGVVAGGRCLMYTRPESALLPRIPLYFAVTQPGQPSPDAINVQVGNTKMLRASESICAISGITGRFKGAGEKIEIQNQGGNYWLNVTSQQADVGGSAACAALRLKSRNYFDF